MRIQLTAEQVERLQRRLGTRGGACVGRASDRTLRIRHPNVLKYTHG